MLAPYAENRKFTAGTGIVLLQWGCQDHHKVPRVNHNIVNVYGLQLYLRDERGIAAFVVFDGTFTESNQTIFITSEYFCHLSVCIAHKINIVDV